MMWTQLDPNTFTMMVTGGTLYRYSGPEGVALEFVPWVNTTIFQSPFTHTYTPASAGSPQ